MRDSFIRRLAAITGTESAEARECIVSAAIVRHTANLRRFRASLERTDAGPLPAGITKAVRIGDMRISGRLRKRLKL